MTQSPSQTSLALTMYRGDSQEKLNTIRELNKTSANVLFTQRNCKLKPVIRKDFVQTKSIISQYIENRVDVTQLSRPFKSKNIAQIQEIPKLEERAGNFKIQLDQIKHFQRQAELKTIAAFDQRKLNKQRGALMIAECKKDRERALEQQLTGKANLHQQFKDHLGVYLHQDCLKYMTAVEYEMCLRMRHLERREYQAASLI